MKKIFYLIISGVVAALILSAGTEKSTGESRNTIRILTYNVRNCRGMDNVVDYRRVAEVISGVKPDVVALQELDSATQRSNGKVVLNELGSYVNMYQTFGASIGFQGGKYGIGILTKEKPLSSELIPLPGREEKRSLLIVELKKYIVCCTHLSLTAEDRIASVEIIDNVLKKYSRPVFLAGDFNASPGSDVINNITTGWYMLNDPEQPTIPSGNPQRCIDFIFAAKFTGNSFVTKKATVEKEPVASDHLPVWVEVLVK